MSDVASNLKDWSATASSNAPAGTTNIGTQLDDNLREIQKVVRQDLATKGADIASATTTDLGAVAGLYHDITGTTTITSFGTVSAGIWKIIKFEGALTLTHNATTLILLTGANRTTANGDVGIYISEGSGNWREIVYTPTGSGAVPTATVFPYAGATAPSGYLLCYGQAISRTDYAALFAVISTTYGEGDTVSTFNVPDLRGRVVAGQDDMGGASANRLTNQTGGLDGDTLGATGGSETHTLTAAQLPSTVIGGTPTTEGLQDPANNNRNYLQNPASIGSSSAHNNVQPTMILNYIIKV